MLVLSDLPNLPKGQVELRVGQEKQKKHLSTGQVHLNIFSWPVKDALWTEFLPDRQLAIKCHHWPSVVSFILILLSCTKTRWIQSDRVAAHLYLSCSESHQTRPMQLLSWSGEKMQHTIFTVIKYKNFKPKTKFTAFNLTKRYWKTNMKLIWN